MASTSQPFASISGLNRDRRRGNRSWRVYISKERGKCVAGNLSEPDEETLTTMKQRASPHRFTTSERWLGVLETRR